MIGETVDELVHVVRQLEDVEVVEVLRDVATRIILKVEGYIDGASQITVEELAVLLEQDFVEQRRACDIDDYSEDALAKHLCLSSAALTVEWKLLLRQYPHEYFERS